MFNISSGMPDPNKIYDVIILGGGPSAIGAAIYAARFALDLLVIGKTFGGLIASTHLVENYPGITSTSGTGLMEMFREHMNSLNIPYITDEITNIEKEGDHFLLKSFFMSFKTKTIIVATGSERKKLNIPGEEEFTGKGVSYCATCDGMFFKDKTLAVIGGSDSAVKEALFLSQHATKVYIIYRGEEIRAEPINKKRLEGNKKIEIITETQITEIKGDFSVNAIIFENGKEFKVDGVFIEIGSVPKSKVVEQLGVKLNQKNEININRRSETNIPGIYAAGDVADAPFKQAITGVAEGVVAAYSVFDYIKEKRIKY
ncbi:MAG: FAD-dependent oxidoreductase [Candidatus Lokiarchaeota archaeon]|nr:FAD-dependent oxidoreductase [Candidatus Lokiarchaeota archaeon]